MVIVNGTQLLFTIHDLRFTVSSLNEITGGVMAAPLGGMGAPHRPVRLEKRFIPRSERGGCLSTARWAGGHSEAIPNLPAKPE